MAATTASAAPQFAPEDPTLPKPWKGLVDGTTGYLYFWNPETNATQYERPTSQPDLATLPNGSSHQNGSLAQGQHPSHGPHHDPAFSNGSYARPDNGARNSESVGGVNFPANQGFIGNTIKAEEPVAAVGGPHEGSFRNNNANNVSHLAMSFESSGNPPQVLKKDIISSTGGMAAAPTSSAPRYAPEDPTLPKPWKGLIDGNTGILYFWNPETNVTVYEKPVSHTGSVTSMNGSSHLKGSSVQGQQPSQPSHRGYPYDGAETRFGSSQNGVGSWNNEISGNGIVPGSHGFACEAMKAQGPIAIVDGPAAENFRRHHEITVSGNNVPHPFISFESTGLPFEILQELKSAGFASPTPIQAQSWPIALQSRDIVAVAKTGSGKTLGYLIPGFIHIKHCRKNSRMGPTVLVLSPTRELATQIQDEAEKFGKSSRLSCTCLYGGAPKGPQLRDLDRGADIVVATPGRLNDILEMKRVSLSQVSYLVLDEADRMLDMGFEPQIRKIVKEIPARRQTLMYTATWPKEVRKIASDLLVNPVQVNIGNVDELVANKSITQHVEVVHPMEKQRRLEQILRSHEPGSKIIIFCSTKKMCDMLARNIGRQFGAAAIHGDKSQGERDFVLNQFRMGKSPILVATDVAARGLDVKDIRGRGLRAQNRKDWQSWSNWYCTHILL
uniref:RNA helicase n=1 Tax=Kalanchoe fedtschenkoi TaxID=63787 RepID=A0A7N1A6T8_KALFE